MAWRGDRAVLFKATILALALILSPDLFSLSAQTFSPSRQSVFNLNNKPTDSEGLPAGLKSEKPADQQSAIDQSLNRQTEAATSQSPFSSQFRGKKFHVSDSFSRGFKSRDNSLAKDFEKKKFSFSSKQEKGPAGFADRRANLPPSLKRQKSSFASRRSPFEGKESNQFSRSSEFASRQSEYSTATASGFDRSFEVRPYTGREARMLADKEGMKRLTNAINTMSDAPDHDLNMKEVKVLLNSYSNPLSDAAVRKALPVMEDDS